MSSSNVANKCARGRQKLEAGKEGMRSASSCASVYWIVCMQRLCAANQPQLKALLSVKQGMQHPNTTPQLPNLDTWSPATSLLLVILDVCVIGSAVCASTAAPLCATPLGHVLANLHQRLLQSVNLGAQLLSFGRLQGAPHIGNGGVNLIHQCRWHLGATAALVRVAWPILDGSMNLKS